MIRRVYKETSPLKALPYHVMEYCLVVNFARGYAFVQLIRKTGIVNRNLYVNRTVARKITQDPAEASETNLGKDRCAVRSIVNTRLSFAKSRSLSCFDANEMTHANYVCFLDFGASSWLNDFVAWENKMRIRNISCDARGHCATAGNRSKAFHAKFASATDDFPPSFSRIANIFFRTRDPLCTCLSVRAARTDWFCNHRPVKQIYRIIVKKGKQKRQDRSVDNDKQRGPSSPQPIAWQGQLL